MVRTTEATFKTEEAAKASRRRVIDAGFFSVSLIAYDPDRDLYVYDVIG